MSIITAPHAPAAGSQTSRPVAVDPTEAGQRSLVDRLLSTARFASLVYLFVVVFLALAAVIPAVALGWQPLSVISGSMQPAVAPGALVMVEPAEAGSYYGHPSILAFADQTRPGRLLTHRVVSTESSHGTVLYTTKGDANRVNDSSPVAHEDVVGAVRMVVPFIGLPATWLHNDQHVILAAWLVASVLAVSSLVLRPRT